ncbi:MAG: hypothetical protein L6R36_000796 [Xanthoria steineri]|nr:MAG: hypothetical protein L6R36_000796 [Xanthoria steineri]
MDSNDSEQPSSLRKLFKTANNQRHELEHPAAQSSSATYQDKLRATIGGFQQCQQLTDRLAIFSPNETEDDIASGDLQYLLINHYLGELLRQDSTTDRTTVLHQAQTAYEHYLKLLDTYDMLSNADSKLHQRYLSNRDNFSLLSTADPTARRNTKITRYKHEQELKLKLRSLAQVPLALQTDHDDDAASREIYLAEIQLCTHNTFHALDLIAQELQILALMPQTSPAPQPEEREIDYRHRNGIPNTNSNKSHDDTYSERLDPPISQLLNTSKAGPLLSKDGKPLKPFTLLDSRQRLRNGVFRPDHALPTMTIDEYLAEEKRRGGIVDGGGGPGAGPIQEGDDEDDDVEKADRETMKKREWDEYVEANPKGSGNTLNRG